MATQWYYLVNNEQQGPVSSADLKQMAAGGQIQPDTFIWKEGLDDWVPAQRIKGLFDGATATTSVEMTAQPAADQQAAPQQAYNPNQQAYPQQGFQQPGYGGYQQQATAYQNPHFPYAPKQFTGLFTWLLILIFGGFGAIFLGFVLIIANEDLAPIAVGFIMLGYGSILASGIMGLVLLYRCWNSIQDLPARTTPGKAVGFLFIPFFNLYWIFVANYGLAQDLEPYCQQRGIECKASPGLALAVCILQLIPYVNSFNVFIAPILIWQFAKTGANISQWHRGEQAY